MDNELVREVADLYTWVRSGNDGADEKTLAELIMKNLNEREILELACDALAHDASGVDATPVLARRRLLTFIHTFNAYLSDE